MPELLAVDELGAYLVAQGVAQDRNDPLSATAPSLWIRPRQAAPEPRDLDPENGDTEDEGATVTLSTTRVGMPSPMESWLEETLVDVIVRARSVKRAEMLHRTIRGLLTPGDQPGGKKAWDMGALHVQHSLLWRPEQELPTTNNGLTYDRVQSFCFIYSRSALSVP